MGLFVRILGMGTMAPNGMALNGRVATLVAASFCCGCAGGKEPTSALAAVTPFAVAIASGDIQTGIVGKVLSAPVTARVTNASGNAFRGASIQFAVTAGAVP